MLAIKLVLLGFIAAGGIAAVAILKPIETSGKFHPNGWLTIELLTIPAIGLCVFYFLGWQLGVAVPFIAQRILATLRPRVALRSRSSVDVFKYGFWIALAYVVISGQQELMRFALWAAVILAGFRMLQDYKQSRFPEQVQHHPISVGIVLAFYMLVLLISGETIWRYAGFEVWMWYYSFFGICAVILALVSAFFASLFGFDGNAKSEPA